MLVLGVLTACLVLQSSFGGTSTDREPGTCPNDETIQTELLELLYVKCRVCERIQEPFMVLKNSDVIIGAMKVYRMVLGVRRYQRATKLKQQAQNSKN